MFECASEDASEGVHMCAKTPPPEPPPPSSLLQRGREFFIDNLLVRSLCRLLRRGVRARLGDTPPRVVGLEGLGVKSFDLDEVVAGAVSREEAHC